MTYINRIKNLYRQSARIAEASLVRAVKHRARTLAPAAALSSAVIALIGLPARAAFQGPAEGSRYAVATESADATKAAIAVMQSGGNAIDGAIAAALALGVTAPGSSGLGGGGFALVYSAKDHKVTALDFRETSAAKASNEDMLTRTKPGAAVGVPGEPAGLEWLSVHYAKKSLAEDAAPAVALATRGFAVGQHLSETVASQRSPLASSPLAALYLPGGRPLSLGQTVTNPQLGKTLARFGAEGAKPFYTGDIARKIIAAAAAAGSRLDEADLAGYAPKERAPLTRSFGARTVSTMPAPSAGGLMQLELLSMFGADPNSPLHDIGFGSSRYFHMIAEGMRGAIADRARLAGDPDVDPAVNAAYERALEPGQMKARLARIDPLKTHASAEFKTREEGTTHLIVTDSEGNVVSLTTTVNDAFGARLTAGDTGIVLNNQLNDFSLPADIAGFGVIGLGPNRPRGAARPVSSMAPTIVLENGRPIVALGGSGGRRIATATTQALLARLVYGLDASTCVSAPRIYTQGGELFVESLIAEDVQVGLAARGEAVQDETMLKSGVQMVTWNHGAGTSTIHAASDPRKHGFAAAW